MTTKTKAKPKKSAPKVIKQAAPDPAHVTFAKSEKAKMGPCAAVRALVKRFPSLKRAAVVATAAAAGINRVTASSQYQRARTA